MTGVTSQLVDFVLQAHYEDLPQPVVHETKRALLDALGCALAGLDSDRGKISVQMARRLSGPPEATIVGLGDRLSCAGAAFANGELINTMDYDAILYPSTRIEGAVIPAPLAMAEMQGCSGKELILAIALAHEIASRVASGLEPSIQVVAQGPERGKVLRPPATGMGSAIFGGVAGAGKLLGLSREKLAHAFGIAGYQAPVPVLSRWANSGTPAMTKYLCTGSISLTGVISVLLAEMGYTGDEEVLDGDLGFWRFFGSKTWDPAKVVDKLGLEWRITAMRYKLYPVCGLTHVALDCFSRLVAQHDLRPEEIDQVQVWLDPATNGPLWHNREIGTQIQAQFSVAHAIAVLAHRVPPGLAWQDWDTIRDTRIRAFAQKVNVESHPDFGKVALEIPGARIARVEVIARGTTFRDEATSARGAATPRELRLSDEELAVKFARNASRALPTDRIGPAVQALMDLDKANSVRALVGLLSP